MQDTFQPIPGFINCARRWGLLSQATQKGSQAVKWLAVSMQWSRSIYAASLAQLSSWFFKTIATSDQSQLSHAVKWSCVCEQYLNSLDSQPGTQKMAIAHLPLYMWGQSGELDETDYGDGVHPGPWHTCFNECVSTNQNESILQLTSLKYRDNTMVFVVFIL